MQGNHAFPLLDDAALHAFGLLGFPLYIYSFTTQRVCWSNPHARIFWNAASEDELHNRTLTPYSASTTIRLAEYRDAFRRGETRLESWTYYPKGEATSALARCSGVRIAGHNEAMLVEIQALTPVDLPRSELRAIEALRHAPLMISLFSESGELLMHNPAAQACFGELDKTLPPGADHFQAMFADAGRCKSLLEQAHIVGMASDSATMATTGSPTHSVQVRMVSDPATGAPALLVTQQDVSQLVRVSRQLAASEAALDTILSLNVVPTLLHSVADNTILKTNFAANILLGDKPIIGTSAHQCFTDAEQFEALRGAILAGGASTAQMQLRAADDTVTWVSVSGARIWYEQQDAIVLFAIDVNHLYETTAELEIALDAERRTNADQRRFLAIASHEFRTPLAIIDGIAQRLMRNADNFSADQVRERSMRIRATVKRLLDLVDNTIERARGHDGAKGYAPQLTQISPIISRVVHDFRENTPAIRIDLSLPILPDINLDCAMFEQAIINLLSNAIKYSPEAPHIEISATANTEDVQLFIRDHGMGIPRDERARIFAEYVRGSNVGATAGTGLGLAIVHKIISVHGGMIDIVDTDGPGTTFRIILPRP